MEKIITIREVEGGEVLFDAKGFTEIEILGVLRLYEQHHCNQLIGKSSIRNEEDK